MRVQRTALTLVLGCGLAQGGCATVPPSPERLVSTETSFSAGRAMQDFAVPLGKVGTAVTEAMDDLKMTSIETGRDGAVYKVQAKTADNRTVMVTLRPHQTQTRVGCRIGTFGDEPLSRALLERTGVRLGTLPAAAIPEKSPARRAQIPSSHATPCPTRRCSRMSSKHPIAIASSLDATTLSRNSGLRGWPSTGAAKLWSRTGTSLFERPRALEPDAVTGRPASPACLVWPIAARVDSSILAESKPRTVRPGNEETDLGRTSIGPRRRKGRTGRSHPCRLESSLNFLE